jgi:flagellar motor switch protein FliM
MMTSDSISSVDFSAPRRLTGSATRAITAWQSTACSLLKENWQGLLGSGVDLHPDRIDSCVAGKAIRALPDPGYAARLAVGPQGFTAFAVFSCRLVQVLVADMLGTLGTEWPQDRPLSSTELSMLELLFGEVARSVGHGWPEVTPLECQLESVIFRPLRSRVFNPDETLVRTLVTVQTPLGDEQVVLLFPEAGLVSIGIRGQLEVESSIQTPAPQLRQLAERIPVTLVVELGNATLSLADMNRLSVGDVLVLDQPVNNPMMAMVEGRLQWLGQPCRLGQRQGFRILASTEH